MIAVAEIAEKRPGLTFDIFRADPVGTRLAGKEIEGLFGRENVDEFKTANKRGDHITAESRLRVDRKIFGFVENFFGVKDGEGFWVEAIEKSVDTLNYARRILFPDQERSATMITRMTRDPGRRPSTVLERLTTPTRLMGEQFKYEQGRQLGLALLCAEVLAAEDNGRLREALTGIDEYLEANMFMGRVGDPQKHHVFSYHEPATNKLADINHGYPVFKLAEGLWVKSLDYPVRRIGIKGPDGQMQEVAKALYDPREKGVESAVIKDQQRSLKDANGNSNAVIRTTAHVRDKVGFRLVTMQGMNEGDRLRDGLTAYTEGLLRGLDGFVGIERDDEVHSGNGHPNRVRWNRRNLYLAGLTKPIEVVVQSLPDYISYQYEVGRFDPQKGMHDGLAHSLYKLMAVADVAPFLWPTKIYGIDLVKAKKDASHDIAARLRVNQRVYPQTVEGKIDAVAFN